MKNHLSAQRTSGLEARTPLGFAEAGHRKPMQRNGPTIKELQAASRVISRRLREKPYQKGVTITAWKAVIEQLLDGRRYGAFSWQRAVEIEVLRYINELDEKTKRTIWESTEDAEIIPNATIDTITDCLYPHIFQATLPRIHRAVKNRERKEGEPED